MADRPEDTPPSGPRRARLVRVLVFLAIISFLIFTFRAVLTPFLVAIFLAYLIDPVVERIAPVTLWKRYRVGRGGAIIVIYLALLGLFYLAGVFAGPAMVGQVEQVRADLPKMRAWVEDKVEYFEKKLSEFQQGDDEKEEEEEAPPAEPADPEVKPGEEEKEPLVPPTRFRFELEGGGAIEGDVVDRTEDEVALRVGGRYQVLAADRIEREEALDGGFTGSNIVERGLKELNKNIKSILNLALQFFGAIVGTLYGMVLILMITAFIVIDRDAIVTFIQSLPPTDKRPLFERLTYYLDRGLAGVIRGQLAICAVNGVLTWVGLQLLGVRYSLLLGFVAGVFSIIPIFGTILSTIPIVLIAWGAGNVQQALLALGWILLIHFVEANFLNPKIMGTASKIHPVVVIFALIAGEHAYGIAGALLAVPAASLIQSAFKFYVIDREPERLATVAELTAPPES